MMVPSPPFLMPANFVQPTLETARLVLEPITERHAEELWELFRDPDLHHFVPFESISIDQQRQRCARWAKRRSPDGTELWLNWAARDRDSKSIIAHFQAGVRMDGTASIGYLVARKHQNQRIATEGLRVVIDYLETRLSVCKIKAWSDTRNKASHRLARKLGLVPIEFIKNADFFGGLPSDEFVFIKTRTSSPDWQAALSGASIRLRPLEADDFEALYAVAADPLIWEQHPDRVRYQRDRFGLFFQTGLASNGTLVIHDQITGQIVGSSRFTEYDPATAKVEIGYTFLSRTHWGGKVNRELKTLMLDHAFRFVHTACFFVGENNIRSQKAVTKLGAVEVDRVMTVQLGGSVSTSIVYEITKPQWSQLLKNGERD